MPQLTAVNTGEFGPPPQKTFFLIIGRVSRLLQGLMVTPTVVDTDYHGEIKILVTATQGPLTLRARERIAQALPLPLFGHFPYMKEEQGPSSLGSSEVYWAQKITDSWPMPTLFLEDKQFQGLLDTGADATVISSTHWPAAWPLQPTKGWCNPLIIKFTAKRRNLEAWESSRPLTWGLRLYQDNYDNGLTFKTIPNNHKASIGPNPQLHHPKPPNNPRLPGTHPPVPAPGCATTLFQPTLPAGRPPSSTDLLWSILNASALALLDKTQRDNASEFEDCWMCFSASPPFYEGIALFGNFTLLSDARQLPFESVQLTLTELSGVRSCVLGPGMLRGPC